MMVYEAARQVTRHALRHGAVSSESPSSSRGAALILPRKSGHAVKLH
jgi:hypothetical protein